jgi:hypothetical protein
MEEIDMNTEMFQPFKLFDEEESPENTLLSLANYDIDKPLPLETYVTSHWIWSDEEYIQ